MPAKRGNLALVPAGVDGVEVGQDRAVGALVALAVFGQGAQGVGYALQGGDLALEHGDVAECNLFDFRCVDF